MANCLSTNGVCWALKKLIAHCHRKRILGQDYNCHSSKLIHDLVAANKGYLYSTYLALYDCCRSANVEGNHTCNKFGPKFCECGSDNSEFGPNPLATTLRRGNLTGFERGNIYELIAVRLEVLRLRKQGQVISGEQSTESNNGGENNLEVFMGDCVSCLQKIARQNLLHCQGAQRHVSMRRLTQLCPASIARTRINKI